MLQFNKITSYLLIFLNVLLLFFLVFEEKVQIPLILNPLGRMHPLLLHLPIGFAVILLVFYFFRNEIERNSFGKIYRFLLNITALSAALVALFGFFLSIEGGFEVNELAIHKWTGVAVSIFSFGLSLFYDRLKFNLNSSGSWALVFFMAVAGHFGASITHGKNYLLEAFQKTETKKEFTESSTTYEAAIFPIFEAKCISCHNDKKAKGQLNMSTIQKILVGGKNGPIWKAGDLLNSHIIQRANLPIDDKKHMPPKAKPQLNTSEIDLITAWIREGADTKKKIKDYAGGSIVNTLAMKSLQQNSPIFNEKTYDFAAASKSDIEAVNTPYCSVFPINNNSPALRADFFVSKKFERKNLENLSKISDQLVELNLAKMPIKDEDLSIIAKLPNLEKLILNQTDITGKTLEELKKCKNLTSLALIGIKIKKENLEKLAILSNLKEIFIWETGLDALAIKELEKKFPKTKFEKGFELNPNELLKLNSPILVNESLVVKDNGTISLKHNFKDVNILYTLDGTEPDSTTKNIYKNPIPVNSFIKLKAIAIKNGWYASPKIEHLFFKYKYQPDSVILIYPPNPKYAIGGTKILTDLKKGTVDNTTGTLWSGYRENEFNAEFSFKEPKPLQGVTVSYLKSVGGYIMPPTSIEIWAGNSKTDMKLIEKHIPTQPKNVDSSEILAENFTIKAGNFKIVKIIAKPVSKLPSWHPGKGNKGWFFVDEVLFY